MSNTCSHRHSVRKPTQQRESMATSMSLSELHCLIIRIRSGRLLLKPVIDSINDLTHDSTGFSPRFLHFGRTEDGPGIPIEEARRQATGTIQIQTTTMERQKRFESKATAVPTRGQSSVLAARVSSRQSQEVFFPMVGSVCDHRPTW